MNDLEVSDAAEAPRTIWGRIKDVATRFCGRVKNVDRRISASRFGRFFGLAGSGKEDETSATVLSEFRAGATTFATMAYIVAVNAIILAETGGTCECNMTKPSLCDTIPEFAACKETLRRDLITATAAITGLSSIAFGIATNMPVSLAPGMGLNAYFAFQVVGVNGSGAVPYRLALTAVFVEGLIFFFLALTGMRQWLVRMIPSTLKVATSVGIGLFVTELGLSYGAGIGAITGGYSQTPLALAGCDRSELDPVTMMCPMGRRMTSPKLWAAILVGGLITATLTAYRVGYALIIGIILVSIISWPRNTSITYFPHGDQGDSRFDFFEQVIAFHPIETTLAKLDWDLSGHGAQFALALLTFLYVDIIDTTATLDSMVRFCQAMHNKRSDSFRATSAFCTDGICISLGALLGVSPVTAFVESGAGIAEGGCTGLTAVVTGFFFLLSLFFAPIIASIPPWATGCTLILVGGMMMRQIVAVNWSYVGDFLPSFVAIAFIPFSYSVAYGLIAGLLVYVLLNGTIAILMLVSRGALEPLEYDQAEHSKPKDHVTPVWFVRWFRRARGRRPEEAASTSGLRRAETNGGDDGVRSRSSWQLGEAEAGAYHQDGLAGAAAEPFDITATGSEVGVVDRQDGRVSPL